MLSCIPCPRTIYRLGPDPVLSHVWCCYCSCGIFTPATTKYVRESMRVGMYGNTDLGFSHPFHAYASFNMEYYYTAATVMDPRPNIFADFYIYDRVPLCKWP